MEYTVTNDEVTNPGDVESATITADHFGTNMVTTYDHEFVAGSEMNEVLESLGVTNLRYPGGSVTEVIFDMTNPDDDGLGENGILDPGETQLLPMSAFMAAAADVGADVTLVIPTKVGFGKSTVDAVIDGTYGSRNQLREDYLSEVEAYVQTALDQAAANGVKITAFEIGNEFWGSGQMTAAEYGFIAGTVSAHLQSVFGDAVDIIVQGVGAANEFSPANPEEWYVYNGEVITALDLGDGLPNPHWDGPFDILGNGDSHTQSASIAAEI